MNDLEAARDAGAQFILDLSPHLVVELLPDEVRTLVKLGKLEFLRVYCGLPPPVWAAFLEHTTSRGPSCSATTRTGLPCRGYVEQYIGDPRRFELGYHDRCAMHGGKRR